MNLNIKKTLYTPEIGVAALKQPYLPPGPRPSRLCVSLGNVDSSPWRLEYLHVESLDTEMMRYLVLNIRRNTWVFFGIFFGILAFWAWFFCIALTANKTACQVGRDHVVPLLVGHASSQLVTRDSGVVDQDIESTVSFFGTVDRRGRRGSIGDVARDGLG